MSFKRFWVVQLASDDGASCEVYQNEPDASCDPTNPWLRLGKLCSDFDDLRIVNMAYVDRNDVARQINLPANATGYFYSKRIRKLFNAGPYAFEDQAEGVGVLDEDNALDIYWISTDGRLEREKRLLENNDKHSAMAGLIKS